MANQIHPLAVVDPEAKLGDNNIIGPFCVIDKNVVIGDNNKLYNSVTLHFGTRLGNNNEIFPGASISTKPQDLKFQGEETTCEIGDNNSIRENVTISRGTASKGKTTVGNGNLLMENMHIGHDCEIGNGCIIGNSTKFAGEVIVDDNAIISACCLFHQFLHIGGYIMFQGGSRTSQDIPPYVIAGKEPIRYAGVNLVGLRRRGFPRETIEAIHEAYRIIYSQGGIYLRLHRELKTRCHQINSQLRAVEENADSHHRTDGCWKDSTLYGSCHTFRHPYHQCRFTTDLSGTENRDGTPY